MRIRPVHLGSCNWPEGRTGDGARARGSRGYACPMSSFASDRLYRIRVTGPDGDPRSIRVAERYGVGQVGGEPVTFGLTRLWWTACRPPRTG
jgi:hypothetical protein